MREIVIVIADHVHNVVSSCAQTLYALRLLPVCGLSDAALIGSPLRAFQWVQDEHRTLYLISARGEAQKRGVQNLNNKLR